MARKSIALTLVACCLAGGCSALDPMPTYRQKCDELGFQRGTDAYSNCLLEQEKMDNENSQRFLDRMKMEELKKK